MNDSEAAEDIMNDSEAAEDIMNGLNYRYGT